MADLLREVVIPEVESAIIEPGTGVYYVHSRDDFTFTVTPKTHTVNLYMEVNTSRNDVPDDEGVVVKRHANGSYTVTILGIQDDINVFLFFRNHLLDNVRVEGISIYSYKGKVHVITDKAAVAEIYDLAGMLIRQERLPEGEKAIALAPGVYVVKVNNARQKVIVH